MRLINKKIQIGNTRECVASNEIYFLGYPIDTTIRKFVREDVLDLNFRQTPHFRHYPPLVVLIGENSVKYILEVSAGEVPKYNIQYSTIGLSDVNFHELEEMLYQRIIQSSPSYIVVIGVTQIAFREKTDAGKLDELATFLVNLRKMQNEVPTPILLTGTIHPRNAEKSECIPLFTGIDSMLKLSTGSFTSIPSIIGSMSLFNIPRENPFPVKILPALTYPLSLKAVQAKA